MQDNKTAQNVYRGLRVALLGVLGSVLVICACHEATAQQHYNAFSKMVSMTSMWQSHFYNDIIRANASRGSFRELSSASRITQQDIQNLCKPFPCGNESQLNRAPSPANAPGAPASTPVVAPPRTYPITATDFRPTGGRIIPDEVSRMSPGNAEEKKLLRTLSNQFMDAFEKEGRKNNVANAFAFLSVISMQIVTGRELSDPEQEQLIAGFNNTMATTPQFTAMTARDKQILTECAVITAGMMAFLHEQGKQHNDAKMQADARQMAQAVIGYFFGVQVG